MFFLPNRHHLFRSLGKLQTRFAVTWLLPPFLVRVGLPTSPRNFSRTVELTLVERLRDRGLSLRVKYTTFLKPLNFFIGREKGSRLNGERTVYA